MYNQGSADSDPLSYDEYLEAIKTFGKTSKLSKEQPRDPHAATDQYDKLYNPAHYESFCQPISTEYAILRPMKAGAAIPGESMDDFQIIGRGQKDSRERLNRCL